MSPLPSLPVVKYGFADRRFIHAALAGVIAPAATIRLVALAVAHGFLSRRAAIALLVCGPLALALALLVAAWRLGCAGWDPLDRVRSRPTVRETLPGEYHDGLSAATLDQTATEGAVPTRLFLYGLLYAVVVPVATLAVML